MRQDVASSSGSKLLPQKWIYQDRPGRVRFSCSAKEADGSAATGPGELEQGPHRVGGPPAELADRTFRGLQDLSRPPDGLPASTVAACVDDVIAALQKGSESPRT